MPNLSRFRALLKFAGLAIIISCIIIMFFGMKKIDSLFEQHCERFIDNKYSDLKNNENLITKNLVDYIKNDLSLIFLNTNLSLIFTDIDSIVRSKYLSLREVYDDNFLENIKSKPFEIYMENKSNNSHNLKNKLPEKEPSTSLKNLIERIASIIKVGQEYKQKNKAPLGNIIVIPKLGACTIGQCSIGGYSFDTENNYIYFFDKKQVSIFLEDQERFISIETPTRIMYFEKDLLLRDYLSRFEKLMVLQKEISIDSKIFIKEALYSLYYDYWRNIIIVLFAIISFIILMLYSIYSGYTISHMQDTIDLNNEKEKEKEKSNDLLIELNKEKIKLSQAKEVLTKEKSQFEKFHTKQFEREKMLDNLQVDLFHDIATNTRVIIELAKLAKLYLKHDRLDLVKQAIIRIHDLEDYKNRGLHINRNIIEGSEDTLEGISSIYFPENLINESFFQYFSTSEGSLLINHNLNEITNQLNIQNHNFRFFKIDKYPENELSRVVFKLLANALKHNNFDKMEKILFNVDITNDNMVITITNFLDNSSVTEESVKNASGKHGNLAAAFNIAKKINFELEINIDYSERKIHFVLKGNSYD